MVNKARTSAHCVNVGNVCCAWGGTEFLGKLGCVHPSHDMDGSPENNSGGLQTNRTCKSPFNGQDLPNTDTRNLKTMAI